MIPSPKYYYVYMYLQRKVIILSITCYCQSMSFFYKQRMEFHFQKIKEPSVMWFSVCSILIIRFLSTDSMSWKLQIYKRISTLTILFPRTISVIYLASILITVGSMFVVVWFCLFACFPKYRKERLALKCGVAILLANRKCESREWVLHWGQIQTGWNDVCIKAMRRCTPQDLQMSLTAPGDRPIRMCCRTFFVSLGSLTEETVIQRQERRGAGGFMHTARSCPCMNSQDV